MWNYMAWEQRLHHRHPQVERPPADLSPGDAGCSGPSVCITYVLPFPLCGMTGGSRRALGQLGRGAADIAQLMGGPVLRIALVAGGMMSGFGMLQMPRWS